MTSSHPRLDVCNSPKRKRGASDSTENSPYGSLRISRIATTLSEDPCTQDLDDRSDRQEGGSPSSRVTGQLRTLGLEGTFVRQISFTDAGHAKKRFAQAGKERTSQNLLVDGLCHEAQCDPASNVFPTNGSLDIESPASSSTIIDRPRAHSRSPPLDGDPEDNPMTWHESEITGHNPTDPSDDGYGINGIGFRPTPAIAWARSQKRKQQLADYRNREAKEARQRRRERRREGSAEPSINGAESLKKRDAKVRFGGLD
jgi:hypothetical protein